jgi:DNA topoisomerase IB
MNPAIDPVIRILPEFLRRMSCRSYGSNAATPVPLACEKVLATIVNLLKKTLIRIGNAEYAEKNKS